MKTLIFKELRENVKLAVLGLAIFAAILALDVHGYSLLMKSLALGSSPNRADIMQPLISGDSLVLVGYFCAIFGAILGWFQIHNERQRDLWAFLIHRPATRTEIFIGKIIAGLVLYALVAGLPLVCFIGWVLVPGHVAAPFEWAMLRPVVVHFLAGIVYYFAGMLTGLRQARWYASRALGLGVAVLVSMVVVSALHFWQALAIILIGGGILATGVWGGFHSNGYYRGQPAPGKLALIAALTAGCALVVGFAASLLIFGVLPRSHEPQSQHYQMTKDGTIYKITQQTGKPAEIADLEGKPLVDPKTGRAPEWADFSRRFCTPIQINPNFRTRAYYGRWFNRTGNLFAFWRATPDTLWYYWSRYGRLVGYDKTSRRFIGSLGPDGFARDLSGAGDRSDSKLNFYEAVNGRIINDAQTVYEPDLEHRMIKALFTATNESCEAALLATNASRTTIGAVREVSLNGYDWDCTIVVTRCFVRLLAPDGKVVWQAAYQPAYPDYNLVQVACLEPTNQFALWIGPSNWAQEKAGGKLPTHVTWLDRDGNVLKNAELPELSYHPREYSREQKLISMSLPSALMVIFPLVTGEPWPAAIPWVLVRFSLMAALVCIPVGWWLGRRYSLSLPARLGWTAFHLIFGIPGLLAFLSVQEWPAREACPNCKKLRVVDREKCEHCGANFAPPETNGTEVFEPLTAIQ